MLRNVCSSEYVSKGHPDKLADLISDAILDECLKIDPDSHVACETLISKNLVVVSGETSTSIKEKDCCNIVKDCLDFCGYNREQSGFDFDKAKVIINLNRQSTDIDYAVKNSYEMRNKIGKISEADTLGAGDQGIVIGYACNETPEFMPLPYIISRDLIKQFEQLHDERTLDYLRPVAKSLVAMVYENNKPKCINKLVISVQHTKETSQAKIKNDLQEYIIARSKYKDFFNSDTEILINPSGCFSIGGPEADTGLTGRKIIVDTYGGCARHGGGAFSGKDASKSDRTGAYLCRWIAKNIVGHNYADQCELELLYAIGVSKPIGININCFGTQKVGMDEIYMFIEDNVDLRIYSAIKTLNLKQPIYKEVNIRGHFGHKNHFNWEKLNINTVRERL